MVSLELLSKLRVLLHEFVDFSILRKFSAAVEVLDDGLEVIGVLVDGLMLFIAVCVLRRVLLGNLLGGDANARMRCYMI